MYNYHAIDICTYSIHMVIYHFSLQISFVRGTEAIFIKTIYDLLKKIVMRRP